MQVAAFFLTTRSLFFKQFKMVGKILCDTTVSAKSTVCLEIYAKQLQTCFFNWLSQWLIRFDKYVKAPAFTTKEASSAECLDISPKAWAAILFKVISDSDKHSTNKGIAPESFTAVANFRLCLKN